MKIFKKIHFALAFVILIGFSSCKKANNLDQMVVPPTQAHFMFKKSKRLFVNSVDDSFKIKIGLTTPSTAPVTVNLTTTSATAQEGVHYSLSRKSITFPAGKAIDSIYIKPANLAAANLYLAGRRDSIIITISQPGVTGLDFNKTYTVQLREPCDPMTFVPGDLDFFIGEYDFTSDDGGASSYYASVTDITLTSPTTATLSVNKLWDLFEKDMKFIVDWSNLPTITTRAIQDYDPDQDPVSLGFTATTSGRYNVGIRSTATNGVLDQCAETITLKYDIVFYDKTATPPVYVTTPAPYTTAFFLNQETVMAKKPE